MPYHRKTRILRQIQRPRVVLWHLGGDFELHRGPRIPRELSILFPAVGGAALPFPRLDLDSNHPSIRQRASQPPDARSLSSVAERSVAEGEEEDGGGVDRRGESSHRHG